MMMGLCVWCQVSCLNTRHAAWALRPWAEQPELCARGLHHRLAGSALRTGSFPRLPMRAAAEFSVPFCPLDLFLLQPIFPRAGHSCPLFFLFV